MEVAKAKKQHIFLSERVQAFSDAVFAIVANFAAQLALWKVPISAAELHQGALSGASLRQID